MTRALIAILFLALLGLPVVLLVDRRARGWLLAGLSFLYGCGVSYLLLLAFSVTGQRWNLPLLIACAMILWVSAAWFLSRGKDRGLDPAGVVVPPRLPRWHWTDLFTFLTIAGYAIYATAAPIWEWDAWAIWALKGRSFFEHGGIDWRFLEGRWNWFAHPDYPILVPLNFDFIALVNGAWSDEWLGLYFVALGVAVLLIVRSLASEETTPFGAGSVTFVLSSLAVSRYVGLAEGALIAFGAGGLLLARRGLLRDDRASWRHASLLLGFAANSKNEGLALLVATAAAVVLSDAARWRRVLRLWPGFLLALPWLTVRASHHLSSELAGGSVASRVLSRMGDITGVVGLLATNIREPWYWAALLTSILVVPATLRNRERFVLLATAIQILFYAATYLATPYEVRWHVTNSWARVMEQVAVPVTYSVMMMLLACTGYATVPDPSNPEDPAKRDR